MPGYLMAFDRPDDDFEAGEARLEQHLRNGGSGADVPAARPEPAEPRTHEEYYEALRAADGGSSDASPNDDRPAADSSPADSSPADSSPADSSPADSSPADSSPADGSPGEEPYVADSRTDHSGWDSIDTANRPSLTPSASVPERITHILDGDADGGGGGHRHGVGKPGKTEFPANWDDEKVIDHRAGCSARKPDTPPVLIRTGMNLGFVLALVTTLKSTAVIVLRNGEVWTGWPEEGGPGVVRNPRKGKP